MKKVTTLLKPVTYINYLGQTVNVRQQIDAERQKNIRWSYEQRKHYWSQFEPNRKARK